MPEGHTIHRLARDHRRLLAGRALAATSPQGRFADGARELDGRVLADVAAHGKHLFYEWRDGPLLHVHLGLFGRFRRRRGLPAPRGQVRLRLARPGACLDLSGPTACELLDPAARERILARLGPDPLAAGCDPAPALERMARSRRAIGALLLDQSVIAGVGNVYRAEALFVCGIDPRLPGAEVGRERLARLWETLSAQLAAGVASGRIATVDPDEPPAAPRDEPDRRYVYRQAVCRRCARAIERFALAGRPMYACPGCQATR